MKRMLLPLLLAGTALAALALPRPAWIPAEAGHRTGRPDTAAADTPAWSPEEGSRRALQALRDASDMVRKLGTTERARGLIEGHYYPVQRVFRSDTLIIEGVWVRMVGIYGPQVPYRGRPEGYYGLTARDYLAGRLKGRSVRLSFPPDPLDERFDRVLAYVYLDDGTFLNHHLVAQGYAYAPKSEAHPYRKAFLKAQAAARKDGLGLWNRAERQAWQARERAPVPLTDSAEFVGNLRSHALHSRHCLQAPSQGNRALFRSLSDALAEGYRPHTSCLGDGGFVSNGEGERR